MLSERRSVPGAPASVGDDRGHLPSCLVLHGLGGGPYELAPLVADLEAAGLQVSAPVLPGHEGPGPVMPGSSCAIGRPRPSRLTTRWPRSANPCWWWVSRPAPRWPST